MATRFEYKFVRLTDSELAAPAAYQEAVHKHATEGWRLVQIFTPSTSFPRGAPVIFELILERAAEHAEPGAAADGGA